MGTIELECPGCQAMLELDGGFAGGVCRCSKCGTMMTVPADPTHERAERLMRPDRPDAPGRPASPSSTRATSPPDTRQPAASSRPAAPSRPDAPGQPALPEPEEVPVEATLEAPSPAPPADTEVFVTASGKRIQVRKRMIATARVKRKAIRAGVIVAFVLFMGLVVIGVAIAVVTLIKTSTPGAGQQELLGGYDPSVNPFKLDQPNFLGIPLERDAIVAIDAGSPSAGWLRVAKDALVLGTRPLPANARFQAIFWVEEGFFAYPEKLKSLDSAERAALPEALNRVAARGAAEPHAAIQQALSAGPQQVILVTGRLLRDDELADIEKQFNANSGVRLDVILLGGDDLPRLQKYVQDRKGRFVSLPRTQLNNWYRVVEDEDLLNPARAR